MDRTKLSFPAIDLLPLLGTHKLPRLVDVCLSEDIATAPWRLPTATHVPHQEVATAALQWDRTRPIVAICQKGLKLSQGTAATLRAMGFDAWALAGGNMAWCDVGHAKLALEQAPPPGTPWVLPATRDRRAVLTAWVIRRWYDTAARILWVPTEHVADVATRFAGSPLPHDTALAAHFTAKGLSDKTVLSFVHALDTGHVAGSAWLDMLPNLHETDEELAHAALPVLDAAWVAHRQHHGQEAA